MNKTENLYDSPRYFSPHSQTTFFPARVMNPVEVQKATASHSSVVRERTEGRWYLCGDISAAMFLALEVELANAAARITAFASPAGGRYCVVSHQVGGFSHRFLLPLYEPCVKEFILGMRGGEVGILLGREGEKKALLLTSFLNGAGFTPLLTMTDPLPRETQVAVLLEMPRVIDAILEPQQIPSLVKGKQAVDVCVSAVLPTAALENVLKFASDGE